MAVPQLRRLVTDLQLRRPGVGPQVRSCGICGGEGFILLLEFPLPILIAPTSPDSSAIIICGL
jgi:hypothetical protein